MLMCDNLGRLKKKHLRVDVEDTDTTSMRFLGRERREARKDEDCGGRHQ
jgi:hypothetical protein